MPHVSVLLLALAIADKEFAAREPVAVLLQQPPLWRPMGSGKRLLELGKPIQGQGQERREARIREQGQGQGQGRLEARIRELEQGQGRLEKAYDLIRKLQLRGRWPLVLLACCTDEGGPRLRRSSPGPSPSSPSGPRAASYVLVGSAAALPALLDLAVGHPTWNPAARFLVILLDGHDSEEPGLRARAVVDALWARLASRVVVLDALKVFAWSAFSSACTDTSAVRLVADLAFDPETAVSDVFRSRRRAHLAGCILRFSGVAWPPYALSGRGRHPERGFDRGLDVQMLRTFVRNKGMRPRFVALADKDERWGERLANASWTGLLGMLQRGEVDVVLGGFFCLPDRADEFHATVPYTYEAISWWVPRPQHVPKWQLLYAALPSDASRGGLLVLALSAAALLGMQRAQGWRQPRPPRRRRGEDGAVQVALSILATALDQPPLVFPRAAAPRAFYFAFVFFFFHFNIVFRTAITTSLASSPHLPGLASYHDLALNDFEVGTASTDLAVDIMLDDADMASVRDLHKDCEVSECLRKLQQRGDNYGILFSSAVMQYLMPKYFLDSDGEPFVERLPTPALSTYITMFLRRGHPLGDHVDKTFTRLVEAGLPDLWFHRAVSADSRDKDGDGVPDLEDGGRDEVLTLEHLTGALAALGLGGSLAVAAFLAELAFALLQLVARRLRVSVRVSWRAPTPAAPTRAQRGEHHWPAHRRPSSLLH